MRKFIILVCCFIGIGLGNVIAKKIDWSDTPTIDPAILYTALVVAAIGGVSWLVAKSRSKI